MQKYLWTIWNEGFLYTIPYHLLTENPPQVVLFYRIIGGIFTNDIVQ